MQMDYNVWGAMLEHCHEIHSKADQQYTKLKDYFIDNME